jgi:hypothetical protein
VPAHVLDTAGDHHVVGAERDAGGERGHGRHRTGAHPVDGEARHGLGQAGEERGGPADGQALVADLGRGRDRDLVHPLGGQGRVAAQQFADAADHEIVGAGAGVQAAGLAERGAYAVHEDDVTELSGCGVTGHVGPSSRGNVRNATGQ